MTAGSTLSRSGTSTNLSEVLKKRENWLNPSLDNIIKICKDLGEPQLEYPSIQIGGTNGKTSTSHYLESILRHHGLKTGLYTSPHLECFSERIRINGEKIRNKKLLELVESVLNLAGGIKLSGFEILTAAALKHFAEEKIDVAVLEVGMGGRWDATSVVSPTVAVITNVELDHTDILGKTREAIAEEKVQIVKKAVLLITGERNPKVTEIFIKHCNKAESMALFLGKDFDYEKKEDGLISVRSANGRYENFDSKLAGEWQYSNLCLAINAAELFIGRRLDENELNDAVNNVDLGGRLEKIDGKPAIILDGAHNPGAARKLAEFIGTSFTNKPVVIILGILADKDAEGIIEPLTGIADHFIATSNHSERAMPASLLKEKICKNNGRGVKVTAERYLNRALGKAIILAGRDGLICVTGSLYTVGMAKTLLGKRK